MARQLTLDYREADLPPEDRALCDYAVKLTLAPGEMDEADVRRVIEQTENGVGPIDLFCSNAGIAAGPDLQSDNAEWQRSWGVNVMAHVMGGLGGYLFGAAFLRNVRLDALHLQDDFERQAFENRFK